MTLVPPCVCFVGAAADVFWPGWPRVEHALAHHRRLACK